MAAFRERVELAILLALTRVGEQFIIDARSTNTYKDQTGNLRSSIGYAIYQNTKLVKSSFPGSESAGVQKARALVKRLTESAPQPFGFIIVCVAGMEYAAAVESRGFDVITGSSLLAKESLERGIARIRGKVSKGAA